MDQPPVVPFDWHRILWADNTTWVFLLEIAFRCGVMYLLILGALRVMGRRGVRQLSIFELSIILGLGSAAGDAMLYDDTPLLPTLVVFGMVTGFYLLFNRLTEWYPRFSDWLEGQPVLLIEEGIINQQHFKQQNLTLKELFGELRQLQVEHLGQVRRAYVEATGEFSVYFFEDDAVRPGLPIWPERLAEAQPTAAQAGPHACVSCGLVRELAEAAAARCANCHNNAWLPTSTARRVD
ncbi:DUF421 domain-containing protein [Hymenobacter psychrophilus]|uniref:Uncharacterized membrane protein YcaP, DUF421 family n=1 Tax=Hymenobacter psychrophilus TaxID=651662 RepID=A0A1H3GSB3_9BACT|nr:DUF421 domain-containing protein [Hymenobacter psychrophilus]SDY06216.1 Uncharacterized membrane protein YcaP, DUF421 family [Hymenobacter psychrophilus]